MFLLDFDSSITKTDYIYLDDTISNRDDAYLKFVFIIDNPLEFLEINVYEPNNKKHQSKYNVKCKDSSLSTSKKSSDKR